MTLIATDKLNLVRQLVEIFKNAKPFNGFDEEYKWKLLDLCEGKGCLEIIENLKGKNLVDNIRVDAVFKKLKETKPNELSACIEKLFEDSVPLEDRLEQYKTSMRNMCDDSIKSCANDERTAAALLTCHNPNTYTFYKDEVYQLICQYFGVESEKPGKKYKHFLELISEVEAKYGNEIQALMQNQISQYKNKPIKLAVQTLFWCMKEEIIKQTKMKFTWIPFYREFAEKLLKFRSDRKSLLEFIYSQRTEMKADYLHDKDGSLTDIDPFTTMGIFNRGITEDNRLRTIALFKQFLGIDTDVPSDFTGIPILDNRKSHFFGFIDKRNANDIENLWTLFEKILKEEDIEDIFNVIITQYAININVTMGLFWVCPNDFLALDGLNKKYLKTKYNIEIPSKVPKYEEYKNILEDIKQCMKSGKIKEKSFYELSAGSFSGDLGFSNVGKYDDVLKTWKRRKNMVLVGAPGTGKTYVVPEYVVRLCCPNIDEDKLSRKQVMERYEELKSENRVAFTTFHQSFDYEDWMEGLCPVVDGESNQITYDIKTGIFKNLCEDAERPIIKDKTSGISGDAKVWKVSLGGSGENDVRKDCMNNNRIRIGWDYYGAVISEETDWASHNNNGKIILEAFCVKMNVGDIILSCYSNKTIDAIGVVTGDYEYRDELPTYKRVRAVKWLVKGINENVYELNDNKFLTTGSVYQLRSMSLDKVKSLLDKHKQESSMETNNQPYVMVIDELNRGNVSKIFGELITLLEPDKRKGCINSESVLLPYSKQSFSIPSNVYVLATMNTADRSLGSLDYAIRRRFSFVAERPHELNVPGFDVDLFRKVSELFISNYDECCACEWCDTVRLESAETLSEDFKPEDVWIGHSYFIMEDENGNNIKSERLKYEIIPLLEEYVRDGILNQDAQTVIDQLYEEV